METRETSPAPAEMERYGTIEGWASAFDLRAHTVRQRVEESPHVLGRRADNRVIRFYAESVVRARCADLMSDLPQAGTDGFFEISSDNGPVKYGNVKAWSRTLGIAESMSRQLEGAPSIKARMPGGQIYDFYAEPVVRERCAQKLVDLPVGDGKGFFTAVFEGAMTRHGTSYAWANEFVLPRTNVSRRLERTEGVAGKDAGGQTRTFYPEPIVRTECADMLSAVPEADADGFFTIPGPEGGTLTYGHITGWCKRLGLSPSPLKARLDRARGISGKAHKREIIHNGFFEESYVLSLFGNMLSLPQAQEDGFFEREHDGTMERHGSIGAWERKLGINRNKIERRLGDHKGISGKNAMGNVLENGFFPESVIREVCADLLSTLES